MEETAGEDSVDRALPRLSSLVQFPVKIRPLPVEDLPRQASCTIAMSPATSEDGSMTEVMGTMNIRSKAHFEHATLSLDY